MTMKYFHSQKGITLIEMLIALALVGIVVTAGFRMLIFGIDTHARTANEYELQSSMRIAAEATSQIVKYSTALFTIPQSSFRADNLTAGWNYFGISDDRREIVQYIFRGGTHQRVVVVPAQENMTYEFQFDKTNPHEVDKLLRFRIIGHLDGSTTDKVVFASELEAQNALQVVNKGTVTDPAVAIAYRADERPTDVVVGHVTMILDRSGSMDWDMNGNSGAAIPDKRITKLKNAANNMIDAFAVDENLEMTIVPFSDSANMPDPQSASSRDNHQHYDVSDVGERATLKGIVNSLSANGGTNTGDGIRRAHYRVLDFENTLNPNFTARNYVIILVDGVSTFASVTDSTWSWWGTLNGVTYKNNDGFLNPVERIDTWQHAGLAGDGGNLDPYATAYVNSMGAMIRNHVNNGRHTKVYVIGFTNRIGEQGSVSDIAEALGAEEENVYRFTDGMDLTDVFSEIRADIMKDLWHVRGPNL